MMIFHAGLFGLSLRRDYPDNKRGRRAELSWKGVTWALKNENGI